MEKMTQYAKRKANMTPEQIEYEKAQRRKKDAVRRANRSEEDKYRIKYINRRSAARVFLTQMIKENDKEEFKKLLNNL